jgi:hypothetical protein
MRYPLYHQFDYRLGYVFLGTTLIARMIRRIAIFLYKSALQHTQVIFENPDDAALFQKCRLSMRIISM